MQAVKAADLLAASNYDVGSVAKGLVTAIARRAEIDECFEPKDKQGKGFTGTKLEECLSSLDKITTAVDNRHYLPSVRELREGEFGRQVLSG